MEELQELPLALLSLVADVFNGIENGGAWPDPLLFGVVPLSPKSSDPANEAPAPPVGSV